MAASERAIKRNAELLRQGKIRSRARGAARGAFIDWDVTGTSKVFNLSYGIINLSCSSS